MPPYRAVLFDFFGTLTYSVRRGPLHAEVARILGCRSADLVAVLDRSFYPRSRGLHGSAEGSLIWACQQLGLSPEPERLRAALAARVRAISADMTLRPEARHVLWSLRRRGLRTAVVSDCGYELPDLLPRLSIAPLLDTRVYSVDVGQTKPHPAMYLTACERLGVAPQECVYIGDGGSQELTGAAELGMSAVRLASPDLATHLVFNADHAWHGRYASSLAEAAAMVDYAGLRPLAPDGRRIGIFDRPLVPV
jgi:putative hydrolase of the HAD superfamily